MSKNEMLDTDLYNFYLPTWEDDREKTINEFLPMTEAEVEERFGGRKVSERVSEQMDKYGYAFNDWEVRPEMHALLLLVRSKFNYLVDMYPIDFYIDAAIKWAIRPKRSELCTAVVWYDENTERFEIMSLRIKRERSLSNPSCREHETKFVTAAKSIEKTATIIASLRPYDLTEVSKYVVNKLKDRVEDMTDTISAEIRAAYNNFCTELAQRSCQDELYDLLNKAKLGEAVTFAPEGRLMLKYNKYVEERDRLQEKKEHAGEQGDMYMLRSFVTGNVACVYRSPSEGYDDVHKVLYKSFDDVPVEIKRAVMTLESVERTGKGVANGVGQVGNPVEVLCKEACGFLVPMDFIKEFIQLPAESVHGA